MNRRNPGLVEDSSVVVGGGRRVGAQVIRCHACPASDTLLASGHGLVSEAFALRRFRQRGWLIGKHPLCPACAAKAHGAQPE